MYSQRSVKQFAELTGSEMEQGMAPEGREFGERLQDEGAQMHPRMGQRELRRVQDHVVNGY